MEVPQWYFISFVHSRVGWKETVIDNSSFRLTTLIMGTKVVMKWGSC